MAPPNHVSDIPVRLAGRLLSCKPLVPKVSNPLSEQPLCHFPAIWSVQRVSKVETLLIRTQDFLVLSVPWVLSGGWAYRPIIARLAAGGRSIGRQAIILGRGERVEMLDLLLSIESLRLHKSLEAVSDRQLLLKEPVFGWLRWLQLLPSYHD